MSSKWTRYRTIAYVGDPTEGLKDVRERDHYDLAHARAHAEFCAEDGRHVTILRVTSSFVECVKPSSEAPR